MCTVRPTAMAVLLFVSLLLSAKSAKSQPLEDFDAAWQEGRWQFYNGSEFPARTVRSNGARMPCMPASMAAS